MWMKEREVSSRACILDLTMSVVWSCYYVTHWHADLGLTNFLHWSSSLNWVTTVLKFTSMCMSVLGILISDGNAKVLAIGITNVKMLSLHVVSVKQILDITCGQCAHTVKKRERVWHKERKTKSSAPLTLSLYNQLDLFYRRHSRVASMVLQIKCSTFFCDCLFFEIPKLPRT